MFYEPKKGYPFEIDPLNALVFPRPIGWISSISSKGTLNLAPYSFFNAVAYTPPQVMFAASFKPHTKEYKDSVANILKTKEFVVNFVTKSLSQKMNKSAIDAPDDIDEFNFSKIKKRKSKVVQVPSVAESPVNLECKFLKKIDLKSSIKNKYHNKIIIGEVVGIYIKNQYIKNDRIDSVAMKLIGRLGYTEYTSVTSKFKMKRPKWNYN